MFTFLRNIIVISALIIGISAGASAARPAAPSFAEGSRLADGHWVKVRVDTADIYRNDYATLEEWGFNEPAKVGVYGRPSPQLLSQSFSEETADDLQPVAAYHHDNAIYFYGIADMEVQVDAINSVNFTRNHYDLHSYYFLHQDEEPMAPEFNEYSAGDADEAVTSAIYVDYIENEVQNPVYGGIFYHDIRLTAGQSEIFPFAIRDFAGSESAPGKITYSFAAERIAPAAPPLPVLDSDGTPITFSSKENHNRPVYTPSGACYSPGASRANFTIPTADADVKVKLSAPSDFDGDYYALDRVSLAYPRTLRMYPHAMTFYVPVRGSHILEIADAVDGDEAWEVYSNGRIVRNQLEATATGARLSLSASAASAAGALPVVLFRPGSQHRAPVFEGIVPNQNLHADATPDMLIFTTSVLYENAEELAAIHRSLQGIDVKVVNQEMVFNEFSSGARMPQSLRRYAKMLYDRNPGKLRWILLYGPSTFDNRGINAEISSCLVSFQCETPNEANSESTNYVADQYFGMLASNYNHSEIYYQPLSVAVGRLPIRSVGQAREVNAKIRRAITQPMDPLYARRALFCSDRGDGYAHYEHCREAIAATGDFFNSVDHVALEAYPLSNGKSLTAATRWIQHINSGIGYLSYNGHGSPVVLTLSDMFTATDIDKMANTVYPLGMFASCKVFAFDGGPIGLGEKMLLKSDGGLIGLVGAARSVILSPNRLVNLYMAREFVNAPEGTTYGEVFKNARNSLINNNFDASSTMRRSPAINFLCYNYGGDPAIPMPTYDGSLRFNSIGNGTAENGLPIVTPNASTTIDFDVVDAEGYLVAVDGTARIAVSRTPRELSFLKGDAPNQVTDVVEVTGDFLAEYSVPVNAGHAETQIIVPSDISVADHNTLLVSFTANDGSFVAAGTTDVHLGEDADVSDDIRLPQIVEFWADGVDDKDAAPASFTLKARVLPGDAGLGTDIGTPGLSPVCVIDGNRSLSTMIGNTPDGDGTILSMTLNNLSDGRHEVRLELADFLGNKVSETFAFTVSSRPIAATLTLAASHADGAPVRDEASFELNVSGGDAPMATLVVVDRSGNTVRRVADAGLNYNWDLADADGNRVADGEYTAYMLVRSGNSYGSSNAVRFTVLAPVAQ